jgi:hypothetical protein
MLMLVSPVHAQDITAIDTLQIDIWPEYDRSGVLVIYRINLSKDTPLPAQISLRIPREAKKPFNLAMQNVDGLYNLKYETAIAGNWVAISFTTPSSEIQMEYYDPRLTEDNEDHYFEYTWPGDYPVHSLTLQVQKPLNATEIHTSPDMGSGELGTDGLVYFNRNVGEVPSGNTFQISVTYTKADDSLSVYLQPVQPSEPITDHTTGRVSFIEMLPWMVGGLGVLLIGGGALWYWQSGREDTMPRPARKNNAEHHKSQNPVEADNVYCQQCGKRADPGDLFCRSCGAKLRIE